MYYRILLFILISSTNLIAMDNHKEIIIKQLTGPKALRKLKEKLPTKQFKCLKRKVEETDLSDLPSKQIKPTDISSWYSNFTTLFHNEDQELKNLLAEYNATKKTLLQDIALTELFISPEPHYVKLDHDGFKNLYMEINELEKDYAQLFSYVQQKETTLRKLIQHTTNEIQIMFINFFCLGATTGVLTEFMDYHQLLTTPVIKDTLTAFTNSSFVYPISFKFCSLVLDIIKCVNQQPTQDSSNLKPIHKLLQTYKKILVDNNTGPELSWSKNPLKIHGLYDMHYHFKKNTQL